MDGDARWELVFGALVAVAGSAVLFSCLPGPLARAAAERVTCGMTQRELAVVLSR